MIAPSLSVVVWKWTVADRPSDFRPEYVNILAASIRRNYKLPHRFICVTDDAKGLDSSIEVLPTPAQAALLGDLPAPRGVRFPSSYRRLWNFSAEAREVLGPRILALDIDVVVTSDLAPLLNCDTHFVSWWDERFKWRKIPGGIYALKTGSLTHVWEQFDPDKSPKVADAAGCRGSDQGWMSYLLYPAPKSWTVHDGVWSSKWLKPTAHRKAPPQGMRIMSTPGFAKPWSPELQATYPWIKQHWRE